MSSPLPEALAGVLSAIERDDIGYVLYHAPRSQRIVIVLEGRGELDGIAAALRSAGAQPAATDPHVFIFESLDDGGTAHVIELRPGSGKTSIANLLWRTAIDEGASAARDSLDHAS